MGDGSGLLWLLLTIPVGLSVWCFLPNESRRVQAPDKVLVTSGAIVALTTATFSYVAGYGTILYQFIVLGAWSVVARLSSDQFADLHHGVLWPVALLLNMIAFCIIAVPVWAIFRRRAPKIASAATIGWLLFYVSMLVFLFRATDGP